MIATESTIAPEVLSTLHQRRNAGESLKVLAAEVGITWQRLWVLMVTTQPKTELPAAQSDLKVSPVADRTHRQFAELLALVAEGHSDHADLLSLSSDGSCTDGFNTSSRNAVRVGSKVRQSPRLKEAGRKTGFF